MKSYYASPERSNSHELWKSIKTLNKTPFLDTFLVSISGLLAILNKHRQIVFLNDKLMHALGINNPDLALGLRPGEAIDCIHADDEPGGCGTSRYCSTCGAAISIVTCLASNEPVERICAAQVLRNGKIVDIVFQVRSVPFTLEEEKFVILFLQDITAQQKWMSIERTFLHDLNNTVTSLVGTADLIEMDGPDDELIKDMIDLSSRIKNEIDIHRSLTSAKHISITYSPKPYVVEEILEETKRSVANHSASHGKHLEISFEDPSLTVTCECGMIVRVLSNMLLNAFEATEPDGIVMIHARRNSNKTRFEVWNKSFIPGNVQLRVFQRNFSTKDGDGRGIGTYSMKLLGEEFLGGEVGFNSSEENGTTFWLEL